MAKELNYDWASEIVDHICGCRTPSQGNPPPGTPFYSSRVPKYKGAVFSRPTSLARLAISLGIVYQLIKGITAFLEHHHSW
jgi:hypothetical protein